MVRKVLNINVNRAWTGGIPASERVDLLWNHQGRLVCIMNEIPRINETGHNAAQVMTPSVACREIFSRLLLRSSDNYHEVQHEAIISFEEGEAYILAHLFELGKTYIQRECLNTLRVKLSFAGPH